MDSITLGAKMNQLNQKLNKSLIALAQQMADSVAKSASKELKISVIIPCFNGESFLKICLESLKCQTLSQELFEVICIDDCSTDSTVALLESYIPQIKNLKIIQHSENRKQGAARNTGLNAATGRYITFLDSDDFLRIDALEVMLNLIGTAELLIGQHVKTRFDKPYKQTISNRFVKSSLELAALTNTIGWYPFGMLISRQLLDRYNIRFREGVYFEDIDFNIKLFLVAQSHNITKETFYYYIDRDGSTVNSINKQKLDNSVAAIAAVADFISHHTDTLQEAFFKAASSWLILQSKRLRDSGLNQYERLSLADLFIKNIEDHGLKAKLAADLVSAIKTTAIGKPELPPVTPDASPVSRFHYCPWPHDFREEFADKVIFYCEVDYHIRSAAPIARELKKRGIASIIVDASHSTCFSTNRPLQDSELQNFSDVDLRRFNIAETLPFATDAAAFVFSNDLTYTKRLIFDNFGFGVPTIGFYEGINDDWNLDRISPRMPYRSVDYLLLPGIYQQGFYQDRSCQVVGLPNVRARLAKPVTPIKMKRAIINVNFTYGVLEEQRSSYLETAIQACKELGLDYIITQHPADKADLSQYKVARESVYKLLEQGCILISRFSTTMLEALAMGRPVVYHNPIAEKVPKFDQPLGAYSLSDNVESLKFALRKELSFIDKGGDVRTRAALFLHFHCNTLAQEEPAVLAANAIIEILAEQKPRFSFKTGDENYMGNILPTSPNKIDTKIALSVKSSTLPTSLCKILALGSESNPKTFLISCASALLIDPVSTLALMQREKHLLKDVEHSKSFCSDDKLISHFNTIYAHAVHVTSTKLS